MEIDIQIDRLTPCLIEKKTGKIVDTIIEKIIPNKDNYTNWHFDWSLPLDEGYQVYALKVGEEIQGMIATKIEDINKTVHVDIVETAPHNYGKNGKFEGVGGHLFAFACQQAQNNGFDYIYFDAKTSVLEYYKQKLGAVQLGTSQRLIIEGNAFADLLNAYYGGGNHD